MELEVRGFDWDAGNWPKCGKHGVTKGEIEEIFYNSPAVLPDPHPDEPRMRAIGLTREGRHVFLVFVFRIIDGKTFIRPISSRYMHQREIEHYEKTFS
jgi:uncharacterized DUF497 family protein